MVDVVLEGDEPGRDARTVRAGSSAGRELAARLVRGAAGASHRHGRTIVTLATAAALLVGSASSARLAEQIARDRVAAAAMERIDGALLHLTYRPAVLWSTGSEIFHELIARDGLLVSVLPDLTAVTAVSADTGLQVWSRPLGSHEVVVGCAQPPPTVEAFTCLVGSDGSPQQALVTRALRDGALRSRVALDDPPWTSVSATDDADVLLVSARGDGPATASRRSPLDGAERWTTTLSARTTPVAGATFTSTSAGILQFYGAQTGAMNLTTGAAVVGWPDATSSAGGPVAVEALPGGAFALWAGGAPPVGTGSVRERTGTVRLPLEDPPLTAAADDGSEPEVLLTQREYATVGLDAASGDELWSSIVTSFGDVLAVRVDHTVIVAAADAKGIIVQRRHLRTGVWSWSTRWDRMWNPHLFLAGTSVLVAGAKIEDITDGSIVGGADALSLLDVEDGSMTPVPWPTGLGTPAWLLVLDHRLYAVPPGGTVFARLG